MVGKVATQADRPACVISNSVRDAVVERIKCERMAEHDRQTEAWLSEAAGAEEAARANHIEAGVQVEGILVASHVEVGVQAGTPHRQSMQEGIVAQPETERWMEFRAEFGAWLTEMEGKLEAALLPGVGTRVRHTQMMVAARKTGGRQRRKERMRRMIHDAGY